MTESNTTIIYLQLARWRDFENLEATLLPSLSWQERRRLTRLTNSRRRAQFLAGRHLARLALGKALNIDPKSLRLSAFGRPKIQRPFFKSADFNISHSGDWAAAVASAEARVGIDIEEGKKPRKALDVARAHFAPEEIQWLENFEGEELQRHFYMLWTRKEGYLKGLGEGIFEGGLGTARFEDENIEKPGWRVLTCPYQGGIITVSCDRPSNILSDSKLEWVKSLVRT